jgi:hypothetical protein
MFFGGAMRNTLKILLALLLGFIFTKNLWPFISISVNNSELKAS